MKIGFISPHGVEVFQEGHIFNEFIRDRDELTSFTHDELEVMPNLALLTMAALPEMEGHQAVYYEEGPYAGKNQPPPFLSEDFDLVALSAFTYQAPGAYRLGDHFRRRGIPVVIGGNHPTALPEEAAEHADFVIIGEGEDTFPRLLEDIESGKPRKFYHSDRSIPMENIPPPRFDLVKDPSIYNKIPIQATRGCPRKCRFCSIIAVYGHNFRKKSLEKVIGEIRLAKEVFPRPHISFVDENMLVDRDYAKALLREIKKENITWECYCDVSVAGDDELLDLMRESGCYEIQVGLETVNPDSLRDMSPWKYQQLSHYPEMIKKIQSHGVGVMGLFMLGMDQDTPDVFPRLWEFIRDNNIFEADLAIMQPLPGSELYRQLDREGRITCRKWDRYTWYHINHRPGGMTSRQLKEGMQWLHRKIHSPHWMEKKNSDQNPRPRGKNPCLPENTKTPGTDRGFI